MIDKKSLEQAAKESAEKCRIKYGRDFTQAVDMFKRGAEWIAKRCEELEAQLAEMERIAKEWEFDYDKLKNKYEPMVAVTSGLDEREADQAAMRDALAALENTPSEVGVTDFGIQQNLKRANLTARAKLKERLKP